MSTARQFERLTVDEYLQREPLSEVRHEFVAGVAYAMVDTTTGHNLIAGTIFALIREHLRDTPCHVFIADMKVRLDTAFYYPDVMVVCSPLDPAACFQSAPVLIVEVLTASTEARDRLEKREAYQRLASLKEYVLVTQDQLRIEIYRREGSGWQFESFAAGEHVRLTSVNVEAPIEAFYGTASQWLQGGIA